MPRLAALASLMVWTVFATSCRTGGVAAEEDLAPEERARVIAERALERMGGREAWEGTRFVRWKFFGRRTHWWDRWTGDVRVEAADWTGLLNLETREGGMYLRGEDGGLGEADRSEESLKQIYAAWVNDSYWMFMPYKLLDPGVQLRWQGEGELPDGRAADILVLSFEEVGLTPKNRYEVLVARDTGLVEHWRFWQNEEQVEAMDLGPWAGWQPFGGVLLATDHGRGFDWEIGVGEAWSRERFLEVGWEE